MQLMKDVRLALIGDSHGVPTMLPHVAGATISCIVGAHTRPGSLDQLRATAAQLQVPLLIQPRYATAEYAEFLAAFARSSANFVLCYSYAMIVRPEVLSLVDGRAVNFHAALLPRNRGPNPLQWAVIRDESATGITMHYMNAAIDAGDIIAQRSCPIADADTWVTVRDRVLRLTEELMAEQLPLLWAGRCGRQPQDEAAATCNPRLTPDSPRIDFATMDDRSVFNLIRAQVRPLGGAYVERGGQREHFRDYLALDEVRALRRRYAPHSQIADGSA
jgi:UDP-4-amino-4-deoxy-L-arabinose formyltransferase/UDP-glucuronic acid dehydrogenase (UDP-4-keto-hexauronic acid decarboxylating)